VGWKAGLAKVCCASCWCNGSGLRLGFAGLSGLPRRFTFVWGSEHPLLRSGAPSDSNAAQSEPTRNSSDSSSGGSVVSSSGSKGIDVDELKGLVLRLYVACIKFYCIML